MPTDKLPYNILLISDQETDINEITEYLIGTDPTSYAIRHRPDFFTADDLLTAAEPWGDIILLDIGVFGSHHSREIFRRMVETAAGIPIIVFTDRGDHDMALWALEDGAADNITRGDVDTDIFKFRDAIAFALARRTIADRAEVINTASHDEKDHMILWMSGDYSLQTDVNNDK